MKVLLLTAPHGRPELPLYPLGLACVAAALQGKHEVRVVDLNVSRDPDAELERELSDFAPEIVGVSLRNVDTASSYDKYFYFPFFVDLVERIRRRLPHVRIVVGGTGFSIFAELIMRRVPQIDFGVMLEGEETMPELLEHLDQPSGVRGIFHRVGDGVEFTGPRPFAALERLPPPRRDLLDPAPYRSFAEQMGVQTKRGCIFRCIYCTYPHLDGQTIRLLPPDQVADDVAALLAQGVDRFFFCDSVFNYPQDHALAVCAELSRRRLPVRWKAIFNEQFMTRELLDAALEAGCEEFIFGSDGSTGDTLARLRKNFNAAQAQAVYRMVKENPRAHYKCTFMFNGPGETVGSALTTLRLAASLWSPGRFRFHVGNIRIYPHTGMEQLARDERIIAPGDDLLEPRYYDPFPLAVVSFLMNAGGKGLYTLLKLLRVLRSAAGKPGSRTGVDQPRSSNRD